VDLSRKFHIRESSHRIHNAITDEQLATLGRVLRVAPGDRLLDLASGSGELLCTWARDHGITGTGVDISTVFTAAARERAVELGVADRVTFVHGDAAGFVAAEPVEVACCVGATWIGGGFDGTVALLRRSLAAGGVIVVGEPYWRREPDAEVVAGCDVGPDDEFQLLPDLLRHVGELGYDVVELVVADQEGWDRYQAAQWRNIRDWLVANPGDELAAEMCAELSRRPERYARYRREYLGWAVVAMMPR
jgi:SAM-dependent methyltransferase